MRSEALVPIDHYGSEFRILYINMLNKYSSQLKIIVSLTIKKK